MRRGDYAGRNIYYGVREHAMGAITNGLAAHGGLRPACATFFTFSDYMKNTIRLAALMKLPSIFVYTHDSVALGEDGPTHQPIEHLAALRAIPGPRDAAAGGRERGHRGLDGRARAHRRPHGVGPEPPGPSDARPPTRPWRAAPTWWRTAATASSSAPAPSCTPRSPPGSCWRPTASPPGWSACPPWSCSGSRTLAYREEVLPSSCAPGSRWRRRAPSAGASGSAWTAARSRSTGSACRRRATRRSRRSASPAEAVATAARGVIAVSLTLDSSVRLS